MLVEFFYLWAEYKRRLFNTLRHIIFLFLTIAIAFFFGVMWPAMDFQFTATFQHAKYDAMINGPLRESDIQEVKHFLRDYNPTIVGLCGGFVDKTFVNGKTYSDVFNFFYEPADYEKINLTYFSDGLIKEGSLGSQGGGVLIT